MRLCIAAAAIIAAILALSIFAYRDSSPALLPVSEESSISINTKDASVFISVASRSDVEVIGHHTRRLQIDSDGDDIEVSAGGRGIVEVVVPSWIRLEDITVNTVHGDIAIESVLAKTISFTSESGSMMISETSSTAISVENSTGNIILTDTTSTDSVLSNASGFIRTIGTLGNIEASTINGSIYIVPIGDGIITATTDTGNVNVIAGDRSVRWETESGAVKVYGEAVPTTGGVDSAEVSIFTEHGNITIDK